MASFSNDDVSRAQASIERFGQYVYDVDAPLAWYRTETRFNYFLPRTFDNSNVLQFTGRSDRGLVEVVADSTEMANDNTWNWGDFARANAGQVPPKGIHVRYTHRLEALWPDLDAVTPWGTVSYGVVSKAQSPGHSLTTGSPTPKSGDSKR